MAVNGRVLSGIQPTHDSFHLGNYVGALRQWVDLQKNFDAFYCIVDLHALTVEPEPESPEASEDNEEDEGKEFEKMMGVEELEDRIKNAIDFIKSKNGWNDEMKRFFIMQICLIRLELHHPLRIGRNW